MAVKSVRKLTGGTVPWLHPDPIAKVCNLAGLCVEPVAWALLRIAFKKKKKRFANVLDGGSSKMVMLITFYKHEWDSVLLDGNLMGRIKLE